MYKIFIVEEDGLNKVCKFLINRSVKSAVIFLQVFAVSNWNQVAFLLLIW